MATTVAVGPGPAVRLPAFDLAAARNAFMSPSGRSLAIETSDGLTLQGLTTDGTWPSPPCRFTGHQQAFALVGDSLLLGTAERPGDSAHLYFSEFDVRSGATTLRIPMRRRLTLSADRCADGRILFTTRSELRPDGCLMRITGSR